MSTNLARAQRRRLELEAEREREQSQREHAEWQRQRGQDHDRALAHMHEAPPPPLPMAASAAASPKRGQRFANPESPPRAPSSPHWGAAAAREQQLRHEAEIAELQHEHRQALARACTVAAEEAEARADAEAAAKSAQQRTVAAEELCQRAAEEARSAAAHFAEDASEHRRATDAQRRELEAENAMLREALEAAQWEAAQATQRAEQAEAAAMAAAESAMDARDLARREAAGAAAHRLSSLEERCIAAERLVMEHQQAAEDAIARRRDAGSDPIPALLLAEQAEASRHAVVVHELRVLKSQHVAAQRQYDELARRAAELRYRTTYMDMDDDDDAADGDERYFERADAALTDLSRDGGDAPSELERRRLLAEALLTWYMRTRRRTRNPMDKRSAAAMPAAGVAAPPARTTRPRGHSQQLPMRVKR